MSPNPKTRNPFNDADMHQSEIAESFGICRERVRQIEVKALQELRQKLKERGVSSFDQIV